VTFIDLEFDTTASGGAPLGDIAASLVSLHDLLRDLGTMAAYPTVEFREIQVVAIEMRNPLTIKLSLLAIPAEAVTAFQEICRNIISDRPADLAAILDFPGHITDLETQRLHTQIATLQRAAVRLKRVMVREE
jgi:hypothetical protein